MEKDESGETFITNNSFAKSFTRVPKVRQKDPTGIRYARSAVRLILRLNWLISLYYPIFMFFYIDLYVFGPSESTGDINH